MERKHVNDSTRRDFLKTAGAASLGVMFIPNLISRPLNSRVRVAAIGVGGRGRNCWGKVPAEDIVAMCDVDDRMTVQAYANNPKPLKFKDFRKMLDKVHREIDAVIIATPDHTHFPASMASMELNKHVFVEKPLAHNIWQLRTMKKAAGYYNIVSQMGNQGHTTNGIREIKEWYEAGVLGEVREVIAWQGKIDIVNDKYFKLPESFPPPIHEVPVELDWDLWQGPAAERPFNELYAPRTWRGFYDFGTGKLGDWCCHTLDGPFWALDLGLPHTVSAKIKGMAADHSHVAEESCVTWEFPKRGDKAPVKMQWLEGFEKPVARPEWGISELPKSGMIMIGDKKSLITGPRPNKPKLLVPEEEWLDFKNNMPARTIPRVKENEPVAEWLDAIQNNALAGSNFDYATTLMEMSLLGVLAQRFGGEIQYHTKKMKAKGRPELYQYFKEPVREGWSYGEGMLKK